MRKEDDYKYPICTEVTEFVGWCLFRGRLGSIHTLGRGMIYYGRQKLVDIDDTDDRPIIDPTYREAFSLCIVSPASIFCVYSRPIFTKAYLMGSQACRFYRFVSVLVSVTLVGSITTLKSLPAHSSVVLR